MMKLVSVRTDSLNPPNPTTHLHRRRRPVLADHAQLVLLLHGLVHVVLLAHGPRHSEPVRVLRQGGHRGPAHGLVRLPVLPLAVGVAVVGLGALSALGQVVAALAAVEALEDGDPQGLRATLSLRLRVFDDGLLLLLLLRGGAVVMVSLPGGGRGSVGGVVVVAIVARGFIASWLGVFRVVHRHVVCKVAAQIRSDRF